MKPVERRLLPILVIGMALLLLPGCMLHHGQRGHAPTAYSSAEQSEHHHEGDLAHEADAVSNAGDGHNHNRGHAREQSPYRWWLGAAGMAAMMALKFAFFL